MPEVLNDLVPLISISFSRCISHFSRSGLVVVVEASIWNLVEMVRLLVVVSCSLLVLFLLHRFNMLLLLLLHVVLLHVGLLLLFLNDLVHEGSFVDTTRSVQSWSPFSISLNLMLTTHWDRTKRQKSC